MALTIPVFVSPADAAPYTYTGGGSGTTATPVSGSFSTGFNNGTTNGVSPTGSNTAILNFGGSSNYTATDDMSSLTVNSLSFSNNGAVTVASASSSNKLNLGGTNSAISLNNTGALSLSVNLSLAANTTFSGNGSATVSGAISGAYGLTLGTTATPFSGTVTLTNANTYGTSQTTNSTTINGGTLALGTDGSGNENISSLGAGTVTINGGQLRLGGNNTTTAYTIGNAITLNGGTIFGASGFQHLTGSLQVGGGTLMQQYAGQDISIDGLVSGSGALAVDSMSVAGSSGGVHFTQGNYNYNGTLTINGASAANGTAGGYVFVDNFNGLQAATVNTNSTMRGLLLNAGTGTYTFGALSGSGSFAVGTGDTLNVGGSGADSQYSGTLSGSGGLVKTGIGTMMVTGANTYGGGTTISQGTLNVSNDNGLGASGTVIKFDGGTLQTGASGITSSRAITVDANGGTIDTNGNSSTLSGTISDAAGASGKLTKAGTGTLTLSGGNSYSGGTAVNAGTLTGTSSSYGSGAIAVASGATLDYTQSGGTTGTAANNISGYGSATVGGNTSAGSGTAGTLNYTGSDSINTTVASGTLALDNPTGAALTGPVTVATGANLQLATGSGNGSSTGTGNTPYQIATSSSLTLAGGTLKTNGFSDGSVGTGKPSGGMGTLTLAGGVTSTIDFSGGANTLTFSGAGTTAWSGALNVINYVGGTNQLYIGNAKTLSTSQLRDITINGFGVLQTTNGQILPSSPEPSGLVSSLLGVGAVTGLVLRRRRRAA